MSKPLFVIKVDRNKELTPSAADNQELDKLLSDEIEQPGLSWDRFDILLADGILKTAPGQSLVGIKNHAISVKYADGQVGDSLTDNAWSICKDIPGQRKKSLRTILSAAQEMHYNLKKEITESGDIVPLIRGSELIDQSKNLKMNNPDSDAKPIDLAWHPIAPGLVCVYAVDAPNSLRMLNSKEATRLGLTASDMKKGPLRTLLSHLPSDISVFGSNGLFIPKCGGDFESSLILDDHFMAAIKARVKGRLVFGVSNKDLVILTGDAEKTMVDYVRQSTENGAHSLGRPISDKLYYWDDGKITLCP